MMWLLGIGSWLKSALTALFGVVVRYPWEAALIVAVLVAGWQWRGKEAALKERDAARAQTAEIIKASEEAERNAIAAHKAQEKQSKENADATDKKHKVELADATGRAARYISLHKVSRCSASQANPASEDRNPEGGIGQSSEAVMVAVSEADIHICTTNTTRLSAVREWAMSLNQEPIPAPEF